MMKKRRPIISTTLFSFLILFALGIMALRGAPTQTKPEAKPSPSPSPNQELLKVEPVAQQMHRRMLRHKNRHRSHPRK
jgi:hypothetical protein